MLKFTRLVFDKLRRLPKGANDILGSILLRAALRGIRYNRKELRIKLSKITKESIAEESDITVDYVNKSITMLIKRDVLKRLTPAFYELNPAIFAMQS